MNTFKLCTDKTTTGVENTFNLTQQTVSADRVFQATGTTTSGTGAATVAIQVSANNTDWLSLGTISLSLSTTAATDGFAATGNWPYVRSNVTAISGTGAKVTTIMGA